MNEGFGKGLRTQIKFGISFIILEECNAHIEGTLEARETKERNEKST